MLLTLSVERPPRLIAHHEEYREADKSDFALQGCSGMKFEVGGTRSNLTESQGSEKHEYSCRHRHWCAHVCHGMAAER
ncbi:hypothetical protein E3W21_20445 [Pseudomonas sp. F01002]|nr:hypothetical protein E3W21_20445 [Pseudomonas sp. F01002]